MFVLVLIKKVIVYGIYINYIIYFGKGKYSFDFVWVFVGFCFLDYIY